MYKTDKILLIRTLFLLPILLSACDATIHEYPHPDRTWVVIEANVDRTPPLYYKEVTFDNDWQPTIREMAETPAPPYTPSDEFELRIILDIYRKTQAKARTSETPQEKPLERRILYAHKDALPPQDTIHALLPDGDYYVLAWADYVKKHEYVDWHYQTGVLTNITTDLTTYPADTYCRSAAAGQESFTVGAGGGADEYFRTSPYDEYPTLSHVIPVYLERPSGRYRIVSTDWEKFLHSGCRPEDTTVKVIYKQYVSVGYNVATFEPNLFTSTYSFNTFLLWVKDDTGISLCSDYLFTRYDKETKVLADLYFYDAEGNETNYCQNIEIPLKRNRETILKGNFLTSKAGEEHHVSIDENFEGEYTVTIN